MKRIMGLALAMIVLSSVGCANARYVQKSGDEGIVAIGSNTDTWPSYNRTNALKLIQEHVGPSYEIVEEREVTVGHDQINRQDTQREATFNPNIPFLPAEKETTTTTTTTIPKREYQIVYRRSAMHRGPNGASVSGMIPPPVGGSVLPASHSTPSASPATLTGGPPGIPPPSLPGSN